MMILLICKVGGGEGEGEGEGASIPECTLLKTSF